jgi:hypothetical protein
VVWLICSYASLAPVGDQGPNNSGETRSSINSAPFYMDTMTFEGNVGERVIINAVTTSRNLIIHCPIRHTYIAGAANQDKFLRPLVRRREIW